ncbi:adhesion G protein-coupled receptor E1 isoform X10 [Dermochelys coriacea]|uniref:adhesion G protein-coupled receptor E1 isoform X10 n=1 Tax=Dermochelys coriacea TaxID=27794 RepID=UPI0018E89D73|nr:adhesion G protein-coupled receptor E1 isoform X10 [Dermochelys coriacea]
MKKQLITHLVGFCWLVCFKGTQHFSSAVNRCDDPMLCPDHATCTDALQGYYCTCQRGFVSTSGATEFTDPAVHCKKDMCAASSVCPAFATCENIPGSHRCACKRGFASSSGEQYFTDRKVKCNDIDECSLDPSLCGPSTVCTNKLGSYACKCPPGYLPPSQPGIPFSCTDINECLDLASCPASATCTNTPGSHFCTCNTGFASSSGELRFTEPAAQCNDIDECSRDPSPCGPSSVCTNTLGSYACTCPPGYLPPSQPGIPFNCTDVDECAPNPAICGPNASCINTPGSYTCQCSPGHLPSTPGPWVPGTTRCTDVASNDPVRKCHNRRLDAAHGSSPDNAAFCTLLTSTFSVLGDPYERKNSTISLVKAAAGFASILEQTPSWSNLSTEQLSTMATVFLQSVESIVLAAFANPAGNGSQTIQMEQLDVQTKVIEDGCPRKDSVISLEVKGETMKISCRTIQGTVARGTSPPPEGVRWISQACFSAAPFRMGMGSPSPHHQVAILHSPGWSGVCLLRGHGVHPEWQLLPWPKGHLSLDEFQGGECRPDQPDQDRFPGSSQLHLPEHHAKQQPRPAHLRLVGGHGLAWQLGSGRVRGPTQQCHSHHVQLQSRLQLGCPHGIGGDNALPLPLPGRPALPHRGGQPRPSAGVHHHCWPPALPLPGLLRLDVPGGRGALPHHPQPRGRQLFQHPQPQDAAPEPLRLRLPHPGGGRLGGGYAGGLRQAGKVSARAGELALCNRSLASGNHSLRPSTAKRRSGVK